MCSRVVPVSSPTSSPRRTTVQLSGYPDYPRAPFLHSRPGLTSWIGIPTGVFDDLSHATRCSDSRPTDYTCVRHR